MTFKIFNDENTTVTEKGTGHCLYTWFQPLYVGKGETFGRDIELNEEISVSNLLMSSIKVATRDPGEYKYSLKLVY
nr:hypothetical protein [Candidatus Baldrarchaeota archaeon]